MGDLETHTRQTWGTEETERGLTSPGKMRQKGNTWQGWLALERPAHALGALSLEVPSQHKEQLGDRAEAYSSPARRPQLQEPCPSNHSIPLVSTGATGPTVVLN